VFGNIDSLKQARHEELHTFDRLETERALDPEEKLSKSLISSDLEKLLFKKKLVGGKNQGFFGLKKAINSQRFSIGWLT
jgi:hypothetical protein